MTHYTVAVKNNPDCQPARRKRAIAHCRLEHWDLARKVRHTRPACAPRLRPVIVAPRL